MVEREPPQAVREPIIRPPLPHLPRSQILVATEGRWVRILALVQERQPPPSSYLADMSASAKSARLCLGMAHGAERAFAWLSKPSFAALGAVEPSVLSNFVQQSKSIIAAEKQLLTVKGIGDIIRNPEVNKTYKEIFANSWIYNTSSTIEIDQINSSIILLTANFNKNFLKLGIIRIIPNISVIAPGMIKNNAPIRRANPSTISGSACFPCASLD